MNREQFQKTWFAEILAGQPCVTYVGKKITMVIAGKGTKKYHKIQAQKIASGLNAAEEMLDRHREEELAVRGVITMLEEGDLVSAVKALAHMNFLKAKVIRKAEGKR